MKNACLQYFCTQAHIFLRTICYTACHIPREKNRIADALANELRDAANGQGNSIKKRDETHKMAQANRAFAHFRW